MAYTPATPEFGVYITADTVNYSASQGATNHLRNDERFAVLSDGAVVATFVQNSGGAVYYSISTDSGATWTTPAILVNQAITDWAISVDSDDTMVFLGVTSTVLYAATLTRSGTTYTIDHGQNLATISGTYYVGQPIIMDDIAAAPTYNFLFTTAHGQSNATHSIRLYGWNGVTFTQLHSVAGNIFADDASNFFCRPKAKHTPYRVKTGEAVFYEFGWSTNAIERHRYSVTEAAGSYTLNEVNGTDIPASLGNSPALWTFWDWETSQLLVFYADGTTHDMNSKRFADSTTFHTDSGTTGGTATNPTTFEPEWGWSGMSGNPEGDMVLWALDIGSAPQTGIDRNIYTAATGVWSGWVEVRPNTETDRNLYAHKMSVTPNDNGLLITAYEVDLPASYYAYTAYIDPLLYSTGFTGWGIPMGIA